MILKKLAAECFSIQPEDWFAIDLSDLQNIGLPRRVTRSKLAQLLGDKYPAHRYPDLNDPTYLIK